MEFRIHYKLPLIISVPTFLKENSLKAALAFSSEALKQLQGLIPMGRQHAERQELLLTVQLHPGQS